MTARKTCLQTLKKNCARVSVALIAVVLADAQDNATFRTGVSLVHLDAEVITATGRFEEGLSREDFRVFDNRTEQSILHFGWADEPLDLILLFDISSSMRPAVEAVAAAAREGLQELRDGDRVAVMVFNSRSRLIAPFTGDLDAVRESIQKGVMEQRFRGATFIQTAADDAAKLFRKEDRSQRRRAVLVITDNYGQRTRKESTVVTSLWEADALLSCLVVRTLGMQARRAAVTLMGPQNLVFQVGLTGVAEKTGGDIVKASEPGTAFKDAMRRIRNRYSLYYALPEAKSGEVRSVRVELTSETLKRLPNARVRSRTGYRVP